MTGEQQAVPKPILGFYDRPMWRSIHERRMALQCCRACGTWLYPPGPVCPACLSDELEWRPVGGGGEIRSWVVFHRQYLPAYPAPHQVVAFKLDEGPLVMSNLEGDWPEGNLHGRRVELVYADVPDDLVLPRFRLAGR